MNLFTSVWKARFAALLVGVIFFGVYFLSLNRGFFSGEAAHQAAVALKVETGTSYTQFSQIEEKAAHSLGNNAKAVSLGIKNTVIQYRTKYILWRVFGRLVASIPLGEVSERLNLFSAICGAFCAMLAFALCRGLLLFFSFHENPLSSRLRKNAALFSGIAGTVALTSSIPFWLASTRFLPQAFETMLILFMGWMLFIAAVGHKEWPLFVFGALLGMSIFETEVNVYLVPIWLFFTIRAMLVGDLSDARGWASILVGLAIGVIGYLGITQILMARENVSLLLPLKELVVSSKVFRSLLLGGSIFEDQSRIVCLCFSIIPFIAAVAMSIWRNNENANSSGGFLLFVLACTVAVTCSGLQISPWGAYQNDDGLFLPTTIYLMNAYVAAYLTGQGLLMAGGRFFAPAKKVRRRKRVQFAENDEDNVRAEEHRDYPVGRLLSVFILGVIFVLVPWNYMIVRDWNDPMPDKVAAAVVKYSAPCTWFAVDNDLISSQIRIHSRLADSRLAVICTADPEEVLPRLSRAIERDPAFKGLPTTDLRKALISTNSALFLSTWVANDSSIGDKLLLYSANSWSSLSRPVVPSVIGYKTTADASKIDWKAVTEDHIAFLTELQNIPPLGKHAPLWLRQDRAVIRQYLYGVGSSLADCLAKNSHADMAKDVLALAEQVRDEPIIEKKIYDPYDLY